MNRETIDEFAGSVTDSQAAPLLDKCGKTPRLSNVPHRADLRDTARPGHGFFGRRLGRFIFHAQTVRGLCGTRIEATASLPGCVGLDVPARSEAMLNVFYNYYTASDPERSNEIDACCSFLAANTEIDRLYILHHEKMPAVNNPSVKGIRCGERPLFREFFDAVRMASSYDDVNAIINSDCCLDEENAALLRTIPSSQAYCLSRYEMKSLVPLKLDKRGVRYLVKKHLNDSQDCWVIRGRPPATMWLDFPMGVLGCDNRLCYELQNAGYEIVNPFSQMRVFHFHRTKARDHAPEHRVPPPYAFPRCS